MTGLNFKQIIVQSPVGPPRPALQALCSCESGDWLIFQIEGHGHFHLQCAACGESYCTAGSECDAAGARTRPDDEVPA